VRHLHELVAGVAGPARQYRRDSRIVSPVASRSAEGDGPAFIYDCAWSTAGAQVCPGDCGAIRHELRPTASTSPTPRGVAATWSVTGISGLAVELPIEVSATTFSLILRGVLLY
jgi:hypothetical protein